MKLKTGKDEIVYLLEEVLKKYELTTGEKILRNTNRKNYEDLAKVLSEISNDLPKTAHQKGHNHYSPDYSSNLEYPHRKYDITPGQIKDAFLGIVNNPRPFLIDAAYIYLFGVGRKGFESDPKDINLLEDSEQLQANELDKLKKEQEALQLAISTFDQEKIELTNNLRKPFENQRRLYISTIVILVIAFALTVFNLIASNREWNTIKSDMHILPYQPTLAEIDSLEGIWLCYTGSPQTRISDKSRYHMVVSNLVEIRYKKGYFTFSRFGPSFDQLGYMQFDANNLVSIHSYVKNNMDSIELPRHSLMNLNTENPLRSVISSSWSLDFGNKNQIIGLREVYIKQGKSGYLEEIINTTENASCKCKIVKWHQNDEVVKSFYLKNEFLDTIADQRLIHLLDEKSIILREPKEGIIITTDTLGRGEKI